MSKLISRMISDALFSIGYEMNQGDIEVSVANRRHGDFSSNVLLKNRNIRRHEFIHALKGYEIIDKVDYINGFVNIFVSASPLELNEIEIEKKKLKDTYLLSRIKHIHNRLVAEKYESAKSELDNAYYISLLKSYNILLSTINIMKDFEIKDIDRVFDDFKALDENIIYRKCSYKELGEMKVLFHKIILLIEGITNE